MLNRRILSLPALASFALATASAQTGYLVDSHHWLYSIDLATADVTLIGSTFNNGLGRPAGLAWRSDVSQLWTIDRDGGAVGHLDVTTGTFTPVYASGLNDCQGIAWDEPRSKFVLANLNHFNYEFDPATGTTTLLGPNWFGFLTALDFDPAGVLWGIAFPGAVAVIDTTTGAGTQMTTIPWSIGEFSIDDAGVWYGVSGTERLFTIDPVSGAATLIGEFPSVHGAIGFEIPTSGGTPTGSNYCTTNPNSTGQRSLIKGLGSASMATNNLTLEASQMPNNSFGYFLTSSTQGSIPNPGGSLGVLCLGGSIGRYTGPGQIQNTGTTGAFDLLLDLTQIPTPTGFVSAAIGETRSFQAWHRDSVGGAAVSNFTNGLQVTFN